MSPFNRGLVLVRERRVLYSLLLGAKFGSRAGFGKTGIAVSRRAKDEPNSGDKKFGNISCFDCWLTPACPFARQELPQGDSGFDFDRGLL